ncbi:transposase-like protein, partial [Enterococcus sp. PF1-24]|uniref:helix-turn-helix domain-containing protein n=1 Tax=unclassified Enterococcus TaxID=2608891 RepID=UPI00247604D5
MSKHNFYPTELKIQIIKRFLNGESAASLREEFQISSRGTIYKWKKWYLSGEVERLNFSSGRPSERELSTSDKLEKAVKE